MNELLELANQQKVRLLDSADALCVLHVQYVKHMPCLLVVAAAGSGTPGDLIVGSG